jgi:type II secretory pathway component GspD/PulD (secretin)
MGKWISTAQSVDVFPPEVLLDVAIYEVEVTDDLKFGLDYVAWKNGPGRNLFRFVCWGFKSVQHAEGMTGIFDPFVEAFVPVAGSDTIDTRGRGRFCSGNLLLSSEFIDFVLRRGRARLVTSGRLRVKNAEVGTLAVTDEVLHFQINPSEDCLDDEIDDICDPDDMSDACDAAEDYIELLERRCLRHKVGDVNVGLSFSVIPFIGRETTELVYAMSMNDIVGTTPSGQPIVRNNSLSGAALIQDGTDICVGGLKRTEDVKSTSKFPILGSIPVLGWLFGSEQNVKRETEVVVVIGPQVVQYNDVHKELARPADKLVRAQVRRQAPLPTIKTEYGFDMWMIGSD